MRSRLKRLLLLAGLPLAGAVDTQAAPVDLLVLYDSHSATYFNGQVEAAMHNWVAQVNNVYRDSQVDIQLRLVAAVAHEQAGGTMEDVLTGVRSNPTAIGLREQYGADFVTQLHRTGECGVGYFAVNAAWAWNVVGPDCGPLTLAHELGHNMGLAHSRKQGDTSGVRYPYGLGHGVDGMFGTVMTYAWLYTSRAGGRIARFSNPDISCLGVPCGVPEGQPDQANAALALNNVKNDISAFRRAVVPVSSSVSSSQSSARSSFVNSSSARSSVQPAVTSSAPSSSSSSQGITQARCDYQVVSESLRGFVARISVLNIGNQPIINWTVAWTYPGGSWLNYASGANVWGRNPYTAAGQNEQINPGQRRVFTVSGTKSRQMAAEIPRVHGALCQR